MSHEQGAGALPIGGFQPTSLMDYPGRVAAVLFTVGCTFRCPFCHNPDLVLPERIAGLRLLDVTDVIAELRERRDFLDGVVITGGEPTMHPDVVSFARKVKDLDLDIKLDTNGTRPDRLERLLGERLVDYVAMDVKAPRAAYARLAGGPVDLAALERSIGLIRHRAPAYEFRTTVAPTLDVQDIETIAAWLEGADRYVLQRFRIPDGARLVEPEWSVLATLSGDRLLDVWKRIARRFRDGGVRD